MHIFGGMMEDLTDGFSNALTMARAQLSMFGDPSTMMILAGGIAATTVAGDLIVCFDPNVWRFRRQHGAGREYLSFSIDRCHFEAMVFEGAGHESPQQVIEEIKHRFALTERYSDWRFHREPRRVQLLAAK